MQAVAASIAAMPPLEADTRQQRLDPALHAAGWTEELIRREETPGAVEIVEGRPRRAGTGRTDDFVNWVCGPDLDPELLMHLFIRSRERFRSLSAGAVHKTVYFPTAQALHVCVPPVDEQRRIAARLHVQLAEIDLALAAPEAQRAAIHALPAALLSDVFGDAVAWSLAGWWLLSASRRPARTPGGRAARRAGARSRGWPRRRARSGRVPGARG
jgi:hypothetical protein